MLRRVLLAVAIAAPPLAPPLAPQSNPQSNPQSTPHGNHRAARLRDYLTRCEAFGFAGSVLVTRDGIVLLASGAAFADAGSRQRPGARTPEQVAQLASRSVPHDDACGWVATTTSSGRRRLAHVGGVRGIGSDCRRYPDDDAWIVVLGQRDPLAVRVVADTLEDLLFDAAVRRPLPPALGVAAGLADCCGTYRLGPLDRFVVHLGPDGGLKLGAEGIAATDAILRPRDTGWTMDRTQLAQRSVAILTAYFAGDPGPLREARDPAYAAGFVPDTGLPPVFVGRGDPGEPQLVAIAVRVRPGTVEVLVQGQRARSTPYRLVFGRRGLLVAGLHPATTYTTNLGAGHPLSVKLAAPPDPVEIALRPMGEDAFVRFTWTEILKVHFERDAEGRVAALSIGPLRATRE